MPIIELLNLLVCNLIIGKCYILLFKKVKGLSMHVCMLYQVVVG